MTDNQVRVIVGQDVETKEYFLDVFREGFQVVQVPLNTKDSKTAIGLAEEVMAELKILLEEDGCFVGTVERQYYS